MRPKGERRPDRRAGQRVGLANMAKRFVKDRLTTEMRRSPGDLAPGKAGVLMDRGERVAAYRDEAGVLDAVSPVCTHLG